MYECEYMVNIRCYGEYMDDWGKFNETSLPEKEDFYSHLNMEDITNVMRTQKEFLKILK